MMRLGYGSQIDKLFKKAVKTAQTKRKHTDYQKQLDRENTLAVERERGKSSVYDTAMRGMWDVKEQELANKGYMNRANLEYGPKSIAAESLRHEKNQAVFDYGRDLMSDRATRLKTQEKRGFDINKLAITRADEALQNIPGIEVMSPAEKQEEWDRIYTETQQMFGGGYGSPQPQGGAGGSITINGKQIPVSGMTGAGSQTPRPQTNVTSKKLDDMTVGELQALRDQIAGKKKENKIDWLGAAKKGGKSAWPQW